MGVKGSLFYNADRTKHKKPGFMLFDLIASLVIATTICGIVAQFLVYKKACEHVSFHRAEATQIMNTIIENMQRYGMNAALNFNHENYQVICTPYALADVQLPHYTIVISWKDLSGNTQSIEAIASGGLLQLKDMQ